MKRLLLELLGSAVGATDGDVGIVTDFLFDDRRWAVRYLVCTVGREVIIPAPAFLPKEWDLPRFPVSLEAEQVLACPPRDAVAPVSDQKSRWFMESIVGPRAPSWDQPLKDDAHLRSAEMVRTYRVFGAEGKSLGRVSDYVAEDGAWELPFLCVHTGWHRGEALLVPTSAVVRIDWDEGVVWTNLRRTDWKLLARWSRRALP